MIKIPFLTKDKKEDSKELKIETEEIKTEDIVAPASVEIKQNYLS